LGGGGAKHTGARAIEDGGTARTRVAAAETAVDPQPADASGAKKARAERIGTKPGRIDRSFTRAPRAPVNCSAARLFSPRALPSASTIFRLGLSLRQGRMTAAQRLCRRGRTSRGLRAWP